MAFATFMSSPAGRLLRAVAGLLIIGVGAYLTTIAGSLTLGIVLIVVGLLPLVAGILDFCVLAPLFGAPLSGREVRERTHSRAH